MIDIIVPTHNHLDLTKDCLRCLYSNTKEPFNLIVVDDSTDATMEYLFKLEYPNKTIIHSNKPFKCGNEIFNRGLEVCQSDYVALVMNSVCVEPEWETQALLLIDALPDVGIMGLKCLFPDGVIESAGIKLVDAESVEGRENEIATKSFIDIGRGEVGHRYSSFYECDAVQWAFCILRREAIPVLEENVYYGFVGCDDIDNCYVLKKNGWGVFYCGAGVGYHKAKATRENSSEEALRKNRENTHKLYERWGFLK